MELPAISANFQTSIFIAVFLFSVNLATFLMFGWDKYCARTGKWRVPEINLLVGSLIGGSIGAKLAQKYFRHKTYKQPFGNQLNGIIVLQILLVPALLFRPTRLAIFGFISSLVSQ